MLKLIVAVLAVGLAGSASAAGWRTLRVDGSSEQAFEQSLEALNEKLSPARREVFGQALKDIWNEGARAASAEQREYTPDEYYRQIDGLRYEEIVKFTDPTGDTAKDRYRQASLAARRAHPSASVSYPAAAPRPSLGRGWSPGGSFRPGGPQGD